MHAGRPIIPHAGVNIARLIKSRQGRNIAQAARAGSKDDLDFFAEIPITCVALSQNGARHSTSSSSAEGSESRVDDDPILHCFPFWARDADAELRSFTPQPRENCTGNSMKRLLGIA